jgi:hypothetical protein
MNPAKARRTRDETREHPGRPAEQDPPGRPARDRSGHPQAEMPIDDGRKKRGEQRRKQQGATADPDRRQRHGCKLDPDVVRENPTWRRPQRPVTRPDQNRSSSHQPAPRLRTTRMRSVPLRDSRPVSPSLAGGIQHESTPLNACTVTVSDLQLAQPPTADTLSSPCTEHSPLTARTERPSNTA